MAMHSLVPEHWYNNFDEVLDQIAVTMYQQRMLVLLISKNFKQLVKK